MNRDSIASIGVAAGGVTLFTTLLSIGRIGEGTFASLMTLTAVVSIVLYGFPRVREMNFTELRVTLDAIKEAKAEVYAREETVKILAKNIASIVSHVATDQLPQRIPAHLIDERYQREAVRIATRDNVISILTITDSSDDSIRRAKETFDAVTRVRLFDLFHGFLHTHVHNHLSAREQLIGRNATAERQKAVAASRQEKEIIEKEIKEQFDGLIPLREFGSQDNLLAIIQAHGVNLDLISASLKERGLWDQTISDHIERFRDFVRTHQIDMSSATLTDVAMRYL